MKRTEFFGLLRSLPLIRFALMLGGGMAATTGVAAVLGWLMGLGRFPSIEAIWLARIHGAVAIGLAMTAIIALVMVTLAFGRAGRMAVKGPAGLSVDLDFDSSMPTEAGGTPPKSAEAPPHAPD